MNKNDTQINRVLEHLEKHGSITQDEALNILGIVHLAPIISDLKHAGYPIIRKTEAGEKCRYYLQAANALKIKVGDKIRKTPSGFVDQHNKFTDMFIEVIDKACTVVDVNKKHSHATVEYDCGNGRKFRETFKLMDLQQELK